MFDHKRGTIKMEELVKKTKTIFVRLMQFVVLVTCANLAVADNSGKMEISFLDAWLEAQRNSNFLEAENLNIERAQLQHDATRGLYFPRVDLNAAYVQLNGPVTVDALDFNPLSGFAENPIGESLIDLLGGPGAFRTDISDERFGRVGLSAIWPVYTGGRVSAIREASQAQTDIAQELFDTQRRVLFEQVVRVYFGVALAQKNLDIRQDEVSGLSQHLNNATKMEEQGQIAKVERLSVAAAHDRAIVARGRAERELGIARLTLGEMLMQKAKINPLDALFINESMPTEEDFAIRTLNNSPVLRELQARDKEAQALIKVQKGRFHPELFVFADYEVYKDDSIAFNLIPDWQVGVGLNFTVVDRIGRSKSIGAAHKTREAVTELSQGTERALDLAARIAHRQAEQAVTEYLGLQSSIELAKENLRLREIAFKQGMSTSVELVDAQLFLSVVNAEQSVAAYQFVVSLGRLLALSGEMESFADYQRLGYRGALGSGGIQSK
jgi:outer membrane protein TolC